MLARLVRLSTVVVTVITIGACSSDDSDASSTPQPGTANGACLADGSCNAGLVCDNDRCVSPGSGGSGGTAAGGSGAVGTGAVPNTGGVSTGGTNSTGGTGVAPAQGDEGGACYGNGTCNGTLACVSGICRMASGGGGTSGSGGTPAGGSGGVGGVASTVCDGIGWTDAATALCWHTDSIDDQMTQRDAQLYCQALVDGLSGWRLPTIDELKAQVTGCTQTDACTVSDPACLDSTCAPNDTSHPCWGCESLAGPGPAGCYWQVAFGTTCLEPVVSGTPVSDDSFNYWTVRFSNGMVQDEFSVGTVLCVK
jgi:hypothetical protein